MTLLFRPHVLDESLLATALTVGLTTDVETSGPVEAGAAGEAFETSNVPGFVSTEFDKVVSQSLATLRTAAAREHFGEILLTEDNSLSFLEHRLCRSDKGSTGSVGCVTHGALEAIGMEELVTEENVFGIQEEFLRGLAGAKAHLLASCALLLQFGHNDGLVAVLLAIGTGLGVQLNTGRFAPRVLDLLHSILL